MTILPPIAGTGDIAAFASGTHWLLDNQVVLIERIEGLRALVRILESGVLDSVPLVDLQPTPPSGDAHEKLKPLNEYDDETWEEANRLQVVFDEFLSSPQSRADKKAMYHRIGRNNTTVRKKLRAYRASRSFIALLPRKKGPQEGASYLSYQVDRLIDEHLNDLLASMPGGNEVEFTPAIQNAAIALGLRPPSESSVRRRLAKKKTRLVLSDPDERHELHIRTKPVRGSTSEGIGPLEQVQVDHTVVDAHIVDDRYRSPMGRPVLTILIDVCTRVILGMLLSLEAPSRLSVALALDHAVFSKKQWLESLGLPSAFWPGFGLMQSLKMDNASEFKAPSFNRSAQVYRINLHYRPVGDPANGGIVERVIGTLMGKVRFVPGRSHFDLIGKPARNAHKKGIFTLSELLAHIASVISTYHKQRHSELNMPPGRAWERAFELGVLPPQIPGDEKAFLREFMPGDHRTLLRDGIHIHSAVYRPLPGQEIDREHYGRKYLVRWDPREISTVHAEIGKKSYFFKNDLPPMSLWERHAIRKMELEQGQDMDREMMGIEVADRRDRILAAAGRTDALRSNREAQRLREHLASIDQHVRPTELRSSLLVLPVRPRAVVDES